MNTRFVRRAVALLTGLVLTGGLASVVTAPADAAATRPTWSTSAATVNRTPWPLPQVTGIRVGRHATFDRVVVDLSGKAPGYRIRYVKTLVQDGSGLPVELRGRATLEIVLNPARAHSEPSGESTLRTPARQRWFYPQVKQTALVGDFEGYVQIGVGLHHKAPFRVFTLSDRTRIVVDIRH